MSLPENDAVEKHLDALTRQLAKQNNFARMFVVGLCYGIGFIVGSAIVATILLGIFGPVLGQIPWVRKAYTTGVGILHIAPPATSTPTL